MPSWQHGRRQSPSERGYDWEWRKARDAYIRENPLCVMCLPKRIVQATVVDHIIPHKGDQTLFWDRGNWQSLCKPHHDRDKQKMDRGQTLVSFGPDGWPIS
jgi:5-methylcytosine-specific restriction endonuclease McrA